MQEITEAKRVVELVAMAKNSEKEEQKIKKEREKVEKEKKDGRKRGKKAASFSAGSSKKAKTGRKKKIS